MLDSMEMNVTIGVRQDSYQRLIFSRSGTKADVIFKIPSEARMRNNGDEAGFNKHVRDDVRSSRCGC